jgi:carboxypeptidase Taq
MSIYYELLNQYRKIVILKTVEKTLRWDMDTKMPPKGVALRSEQLAFLKSLEHKMIIDPKIEYLLKKIYRKKNHDQMNNIQKRNVYLIKKMHLEKNSLPEKLVSMTEKQRVVTIDAWKKAKKAADFNLYKKQLKKMADLKCEAAEILMNVKEVKSPYDALIDIYEPGMTSYELTKIFSELKKGLVKILKKTMNSSTQPDISILKNKVPITVQKKISMIIAKYMRYDIESSRAGGRIDETEHPFTSGYYDDVRITTHYYPENFTSSIFSTLHEIGHAIYDQNLRRDWIYSPVGDFCSYGIHESQSRFAENIIGRSKEFWTFIYPKIKKMIKTGFSDISLDSFVLALNNISPSKIRIESDEVTYCLHIIIRFEIERDWICGKIDVEDIPEIWNDKYKDYLGVNIENDSEGVMQDVHWASGYQGYFPAYALGNIYCGQILSTIEKKIPEWKNEIAKGEVKNIVKWLINNIYKYGNLYDPPKLIKHATGQEIKVEYYLKYLNDKASQLYSFI